MCRSEILIAKCIRIESKVQNLSLEYMRKLAQLAREGNLLVL